MNLPTEFDGFLYSQLQPTPEARAVTVLSSLARIDLDPWEEAARLARLPRSEAARSFASSLRRSSGVLQSSLGTEVFAARLVAMLPSVQPTTDAVPVNPAAPEKRTVRTQLGPNFWVIWLCLQVLLLAYVSFQDKPAMGSKGGDTSSSRAAQPRAVKSAGSEATDTKTTGTAQSGPSISEAAPPSLSQQDEQ